MYWHCCYKSTTLEYQSYGLLGDFVLFGLPAPWVTYASRFLILDWDVENVQHRPTWGASIVGISIVWMSTSTSLRYYNVRIWVCYILLCNLIHGQISCGLCSCPFLVLTVEFRTGEIHACNTMRYICKMPAREHFCIVQHFIALQTLLCIAIPDLL